MKSRGIGADSLLGMMSWILPVHAGDGLVCLEPDTRDLVEWSDSVQLGSYSNVLINTPLDQTVLPDLIGDCVPSQESQVLVSRLRFSGPDRTQIVDADRFQLGDGDLGSSRKYSASSVKLFTAILAARQLQDLGFSPSVSLSFEGWGQSTDLEARALIAQSLGPSDNRSYNHLLAFLGPRELRERLQNLGLNLDETILRRAYFGSDWTEVVGADRDFARLPEITVHEGESRVVISARNQSAMGSDECSMSSCTSLEDLNTAIATLMLQDVTGIGAGFGLNSEWMQVIQDALRSDNPDRPRGHEMIQGLSEGMDDPADLVFYSKPGYVDSLPTVIDNAFFVDPVDPSVAWVVTAQVPSANRQDIRQIGECVGDVLSQLP